AGGEVVVAFGAGEALVDEVAEFRAVEREVEAEIALGPLEAELEGIGALDRQVRIADLEGGRRVVRSLVVELGGIRCALYVLGGEARGDPIGKVIEEARADALRDEIPARRGFGRIVGRRQEAGREGRRRARDVVTLDAAGNLKAQSFRQLQLL